MTDILLIDETQKIRSEISELLEDNNYTVFEAENIDSALNLLSDRQFELIISDIMLRGLTDLEFFKKHYPLIEIKNKIPITFYTPNIIDNAWCKYSCEKVNSNIPQIISNNQQERRKLKLAKELYDSKDIYEELLCIQGFSKFFCNKIDQLKKTTILKYFERINLACKKIKEHNEKIITLKEIESYDSILNPIVPPIECIISNQMIRELFNTIYRESDFSILNFVTPLNLTINIPQKYTEKIIEEIIKSIEEIIDEIESIDVIGVKKNNKNSLIFNLPEEISCEHLKTEHLKIAEYVLLCFNSDLQVDKPKNKINRITVHFSNDKNIKI